MEATETSCREAANFLFKAAELTMMTFASLFAFLKIVIVYKLDDPVKTF
jgi:hypothetical protein